MPPAQPTTEDQPESPGSDDPDSSRPAPQPHAQITVETVFNTDPVAGMPDGWIAQQLAHATRLAGVSQADLTLVVVADEQMARLHEQYTGVADTTDVLTFDLAEDTERDTDFIEGDIVICLDEARRQADKRGHPVHHELLLYAVHGLLHLIGEDDHDEADYQKMHAREDALLEQLGIGRVFNPKTNPDA